MSSCASRLGGSRSPGVRLFEKRRDALAGDAEQVGDGFDGEAFGSERQRFCNSEFCAGGFEDGLVRRQQFHHSRLGLVSDEGDEVITCEQALAEMFCSVSQFETSFDICLGGELDLAECGEESTLRLMLFGHGEPVKPLARPLSIAMSAIAIDNVVGVA